MYSLPDTCIICLQLSKTIKVCEGVRGFENSVKSKLQNIAPEVDWLDDYNICEQCIHKLIIASNFRELCLKVKEFVKVEHVQHTKDCLEPETNFDIRYDQDCNDDQKDNTSDAEKRNPCDIVICKHCNKEFKTKSKLELHIQQEHKLEKREEFVKIEHGQNTRDCLEPEMNFEDSDYTINNQDFDDQDDIDNSSNFESEEINPCDILVCYHCNMEFKTKSILKMHIQKEHKLVSSTFKYKRKESCKKCGRRYVSVQKLRAHTLICDGITRHCKSKAEFQCGTCLKYYTTLKILKAHKLKCKQDDLIRTEFQCMKCNKYYKNEKILKAHQTLGCKQESTISELTCKICNDTVKTSLEMQEHLFKMHSSRLHCYKCNITFQATREHNAHKQEVHKKDFQKQFNCELCGENFKVLRKIVDHYVNVHSLDKETIKPYSCDLCSKRFRKSTNLITHRLYHDGNRTNICSFCGKSFITKNDLVAHEHTHYKFRKYKCDQCEKAFKTNTTLRAHYLIVHTDPALWKYVCRVCNKRFPQKSNHDQHLRRHLGEKNFECPVCEKLFTSKSEMEDHVKWHSNQRPFHCEYCNKDYRKRYTYNVHLTKIHGIGNANIKIPEKKYPCHICPGKFTDKSKLTRHLCTHSGVKPFACTLCEKKFIDKSYLRHHVKVVHPTENNN